MCPKLRKAGMTRGGKRGRRSRPPQKVDAVIKKDMPASEAVAPIVASDPLPTVDEAAEKLAPFFESNPYSTIDRAEDDPGKLQISKPWGDTSVAIIIGDGFDRIAAVLNAVVLPERFSAVWHRDLRKLEVIWTAYKLPAVWQEIFGRKFKFEHEGRQHHCEFGVSSDHLLILAEFVQPLTISETIHRNMQSMRALVIAQARGRGTPNLDQPRSFWIDNIDWDEGAVLDLVSHLNFFMSYFDGLSPSVLVHDTPDEPLVPKRTRYIRGKFPAEISSRPLDENLLSFWSFASGGNPMLRFLLYYRILEYAAVHFIDDSIRDELRKLILSPDLRSDLAKSVENIVGAMSGSKLSDAQRLQALMRSVIDPALLWRDIKANIGFFSKDTNFDGGFSVKAMVNANDTEASFRARGLENLADTFRKIRNALSHGKDQETAGVIRPTRKNFELFSQWVHLIATAAGEVVLYRDAT